MYHHSLNKYINYVVQGLIGEKFCKKFSTLGTGDSFVRVNHTYYCSTYLSKICKIVTTSLPNFGEGNSEDNMNEVMT